MARLLQIFWTGTRSGLFNAGLQSKRKFVARLMKSCTWPRGYQ